VIELAVIIAAIAVILLPFAFVAAGLRDPQRTERRLARRHKAFD
jgi:hypothetical protein